MKRPRWRCAVEDCPTAGQWHTDADPEKAWTKHYQREHLTAERNTESA